MRLRGSWEQALSPGCGQETAALQNENKGSTGLACQLIESPECPSESLVGGSSTRSARQRASGGKFPAPVTLTREVFLPLLWLGGFQGEMENEKRVLQSPALAWMAVCVTGAGWRWVTQITLAEFISIKNLGTDSAHPLSALPIENVCLCMMLTVTSQR